MKSGRSIRSEEIEFVIMDNDLNLEQNLGEFATNALAEKFMKDHEFSNEAVDAFRKMTDWEKQENREIYTERFEHLRPELKEVSKQAQIVAKQKKDIAAKLQKEYKECVVECEGEADKIVALENAESPNLEEIEEKRAVYTAKFEKERNAKKNLADMAEEDYAAANKFAEEAYEKYRSCVEICEAEADAITKGTVALKLDQKQTFRKAMTGGYWAYYTYICKNLILAAVIEMTKEDKGKIF